MFRFHFTNRCTYRFMLCFAIVPWKWLQYFSCYPMDWDLLKLLQKFMRKDVLSCNMYACNFRVPCFKIGRHQIFIYFSFAMSNFYAVRSARHSNDFALFCVFYLVTCIRLIFVWIILTLTALCWPVDLNALWLAGLPPCDLVLRCDWLSQSHVMDCNWPNHWTQPSCDWLLLTPACSDWLSPVMVAACGAVCDRCDQDYLQHYAGHLSAGVYVCCHWGAAV